MPERTPLPAGTVGTEPGPLTPRADQDAGPGPGGTAGSAGAVPPMPSEVAATAGTAGSGGAVPPMPSEVTHVRTRGAPAMHARARRPAGGWLRRAMVSLRRAPRQP